MGVGGLGEGGGAVVASRTPQVPESMFLHRLQQWARREAELQVRERERRGLPLLDSNYYDPARLALPPPRVSQGTWAPPRMPEAPSGGGAGAPTVRLLIK